MIGVMPLRPCLDCGKIADGTRCAVCRSKSAAARERRRGNRHQRGYDNAHYEMRAQLLPLAYGKACPRCGELMLRGQDLDLGHRVGLRVDPSSRADRIEHAHCNRGARE